MSDLLVPGGWRAEKVLDDASVLAALLTVEESWSAVLVARELAPRSTLLTPGALGELLHPNDLATVADGAEASGNPVVPLLSLLRERLRSSGRPEAARFLHCGLTSQDTLDTALVLCLRAVAGRTRAALEQQAGVLRELTDHHRHSITAARTLTQPAVPTTFGLVLSTWLGSTLDAAARVAAAADALPAQVGGAGGTLAAVAELASRDPDPGGVAVAAGRELADRLGLSTAAPWHVQRRPLLQLADAFVGCTDVWGVIAGYVLTRSRPEIGELREGTPGGSSTMPHKANPVLSGLIRRASLSAPAELALLHTAAALAEDERSAGPWHAEWPAWRSLARSVVIAGDQSTDLLTALVVDVDRMRANADRVAGDLLAERSAIRTLIGRSAGDDGIAGYLGATDALIEDLLARTVREREQPATEQPDTATEAT